METIDFNQVLTDNISVVEELLPTANHGLYKAFKTRIVANSINQIGINERVPFVVGLYEYQTVGMQALFTIVNGKYQELSNYASRVGTEKDMSGKSINIYIEKGKAYIQNCRKNDLTIEIYGFRSGF